MIAAVYGEKLMHVGKIKVDRTSKTIVTSVFADTVYRLVDLFTESILPADRIYEIRYDLFREKSEKDLGHLMNELSSLGVPYIFAYRGSDEDVLAYSLFAAENGAPAIDIDYSLSQGFRKHSSSLIFSIHLYDRRPAEVEVRDMLASGVDMVKVAASYGDYRDFLQDAGMLLDLRMKSDTAFTFIPMGERSAAMRIASLILVSDAAYAKFDRKTAEGQLTYSQYRYVLDSIM